MKKIFLTSGIILCMACPAFAALENGDIDISNGGKVLYGSNPATDANCSYGTLKAYTGPVAFEPVWAAEAYTVEYNSGAHPDANPNTVVGSQSATYGVTYNVSNSFDPTAADGYTFRGWVPSGTTPVYNSSNELTNGFTSTNWTSEDLADGATYTLVAAYTADEIDITFNCAKPVKDATIPGTAQTYAVSATSNFVSPYNSNRTHQIAMDGTDALTETCALDGWTFEGWSCTNGLTTDAAGTDAVTFISSEDLANGYDVYMKNASGVTCTAVWSQNEIGLIWYNSEDPEDTTAINVSGTGAASCDYDDTITLPSTEPTKNGYVFKGWRVTDVRTEEP